MTCVCVIFKGCVNITIISEILVLIFLSPSVHFNILSLFMISASHSIHFFSPGVWLSFPDIIGQTFGNLAPMEFDFFRSQHAAYAF